MNPLSKSLLRPAGFAPVLGFVAGALVAPANSAERDPRVLVEYLSWEGETGRLFGRGVAGSEIDTSTARRRQLIVTPEGQHLVLTEEFDYGEGEGLAGLLHEESGWWAELSVSDSSQKGLHPTDFEEVVEASKRIPAGEASLDATFRTGDGFSWAGSFEELGADPVMEVPLAFAESEASSSVPEGAREAAQFVLALWKHRAVGIGGYELYLLEAVAGKGSLGKYAGIGWHSYTKTPLLTTDTSGDPDIRQVIAEFDSVSRINLFRDAPN